MARHLEDTFGAHLAEPYDETLEEGMATIFEPHLLQHGFFDNGVCPVLHNDCGKLLVVANEYEAANARRAVFRGCEEREYLWFENLRRFIYNAQVEAAHTQEVGIATKGGSRGNHHAGRVD